MKISTLELQGFGSYRDYTKIEFQNGITGIVGVYDENENKSNGSGKSTLIMAIIYALFGEGEYNKIDEIVNDSLEKKEMFVRLTFILNRQQYLIVRGRNKSSSYLDFFENEVKLTKEKIDSTQEEIIRILGMDYKMFTASIFFEQGNIDKFINVTPEERRNYLDKILNLEIWRTAFKSINTEINKIKKQKEELLDAIVLKKNRINDLKLKISEKKVITEKLNTLKDNKKKFENEIVKYDASLKFAIKLNDLRKQRFDVENIVKDFDRNKSNCINNITTQKDILYGIEEELNKMGNEEEFDKSTNIENWKIEEEALNNKLKDVQNQKHKYNIELTKYTTEISLLNNSRNNMKEGICPSCLQNVDIMYLEHKKKELDEQIISLSTTASTISKNIANLEIEEAEFKNNLLKVKEGIKAAEFLFNNIMAKKNELERDKIIAEQQIEKLKMQLDQIENSISNNESKRIELIQEIKEIELEINDFVPSKDVLDKIKVDIKLLEENIEVQIRKLGEIDQLEKTLILEQESLVTDDQVLIDKENSLSVYNIVSDSFQEIPRNIFQQSIILIQEAANDIIQQILPNVLVKIFEDDTKSKRLIISFIVEGKERSYKRLSGGEKVIVNIGLRLGFSKIIRYRSKTKLNFIALDEPFGYLDNHNKYLIQKVLTMILKWFDQILVISHVDHVQEFPCVITVRKNHDNISYIN